MNIRPLIIDEELRLKIAGMVEHAEKNIFTLEDMKNLMRGEANPAGDLYGFNMETIFGYRVVYSIEEHPYKAGGIALCRHLSMSVDEPGKLPNEYAIQEIMGLIGFKNKLKQCKVWLEDYMPGHKAVNVVEIINEQKKDT